MGNCLFIPESESDLKLIAEAESKGNLITTRPQTVWHVS